MSKIDKITVTRSCTEERGVIWSLYQGDTLMAQQDGHCADAMRAIHRAAFAEGWDGQICCKINAA
jgi:hypothetical protein